MAEGQADRQILAIMFTDVVGYTAITERDEASAVRIRDAHRALVQTLVAQFGGEVVDVTGDESLSIFPSALRAVDCAIAIQSALRSDPELRLRIGIHLGDVLRKNGEVIGDGVNIASRVRPLAEPGGICVSEPVYQMVRSRTHVSSRSLGSRALKNVAAPLNVYALSAGETGAAAPMPKQRRRNGLMIAAAAVILVLGVVAMQRDALLAWLALNVPRLTGGSVEQQIGFATTADGVQIAYSTAGAGPPLVLVLGWATHLTEGMGSPLYDQAGSLAFWSREHTVVRYDGRGFGLSDRDVTDFSLDARVGDLETVVDALGLEEFVLYAYSAGGPTAIEYTARHPERVAKLVLAASFARQANDSRRTEGLQSMIQFVGSGWHTPAARAALAEFVAPEANEVQRRVLMHFMGVAAEGEQIVGFLSELAEIDVSDRAREISVPTLVIASDVDTTVLLAQSRQLASLVPDARFEVVEGASHIEACLLDPRVMQLVSGFVAKDAQPAAVGGR